MLFAYSMMTELLTVLVGGKHASTTFIMPLDLHYRGSRIIDVFYSSHPHIHTHYQTLIKWRTQLLYYINIWDIATLYLISCLLCKTARHELHCTLIVGRFHKLVYLSILFIREVKNIHVECILSMSVSREDEPLARMTHIALKSIYYYSQGGLLDSMPYDTCI